MENVRERAERSWFGYGRWSAPYWFVGMEPGGDASDDDYKAWMALGGGELIGCRDHAVKTGFLRWHEAERPPTQSTWRRLIQLELSYAGEATNMDAVARYQRERWAALDGREALIELFSVAAPSLNVAVDRTTYLDERIARIAERLREHQPTFAVFYGLGYREAYERIVGARFDSESLACCGKTVCILVPHPVARKSPTSSEWIALGRRLQAIVATSESNVDPPDFTLKIELRESDVVLERQPDSLSQSIQKLLAPNAGAVARRDRARRYEHELRELRQDIAKQTGIEPYQVFDVDTMNRILKKCPVNEFELLEISGINATRSQRFGHRIVAIFLVEGVAAPERPYYAQCAECNALRALHEPPQTGTHFLCSSCQHHPSPKSLRMGLGDISFPTAKDYD